MLRSLNLALSLCATCLMFASVSSAAPLDLVLEPSPDVLVSTIDLSYDALSDSLSASGFALSIDGSNLDAPGAFSLSAVIDEFGVLSGGSISILGTQGVLNSGTLLTGTLTNFGFSGDAAGILLELTFDVTGGDLALAYGGSIGGVILSSTLNSFSGFGSSFDNLLFSISGTGGGIADVAPVPEPGTALLMLTGLALLSGARRN